MELFDYIYDDSILFISCLEGLLVVLCLGPCWIVIGVSMGWLLLSCLPGCRSTIGMTTA